MCSMHCECVYMWTQDKRVTGRGKGKTELWGGGGEERERDGQTE